MDEWWQLATRAYRPLWRLRTMEEFKQLLKV
jgi:hypothetical protein